MPVEFSLRLVKRLSMTIVGVLVCAFSVGMFNLAAFGVDPFQCLAQGSHGAVLGWMPYGTYYLGLSLVMLVAIWFWDRRFVGIATFINMFLTGYMVDFSFQILHGLFPELSLVARAFFLVSAVILMCFGSALYYTADLGVSVYDAISLKLAQLNIRIGGHVAEFRWIRVFNDCICVALGAAFGKLPGLGTLITAFFMGPLITIFNRIAAEPFLNGTKTNGAKV